MFERRSLRWPITLGVIMIVLLVALTVGWVVLAVVGALSQQGPAVFYWTLLSVGATFLVLVLVGVVLYLTLSVKAINLSRRQSNFIDSVTHELKSPIASLKLYLQTLNRRQVSPEEQADFYRYMLEDVERLDQLINHVLDAARLEKQPAHDEAEDVEMSGLLAECAESVCLRHRVPPQVVRLAAQPCVVRARRVDLDMIFRNLIDNAVKYAGTDPRVEITMQPGLNDQIEISIADNGPGIPPADRRKIFRRFVRLGSELERRQPGTGLGLYIVRTLVKRLRGQIQVHGRDPDPGTLFQVHLRGHPTEPDDLATDSAIAASPSTAPRM